MTKYVLQAHRNQIDKNFGIFTPNHSGYDLITYHDDGRITIESLDLTREETINPFDAGDLKIEYTKNNAQVYDVNGQEVVWHDTLSPNNDKKYDGDVGAYLKDKKAATSEILEGQEAVDAFNKMKADMIMRNSLDQIGLIDYDVEGPNCNTWTNHMDERFIQPVKKDGTSVFDGLGGKENFTGDGNDFETGNEYFDNEKAKIIDRAVDAIIENNPNFDPDMLDKDSIIWDENIGKAFGGVLKFSDDKGDYVIFKNGSLIVDLAQGAIKKALGDWGLTDVFNLGRKLIQMGFPPEIYGPFMYPKSTYDGFFFPDTFKENLKDGFAYAETLRSPLVLDLNGDGINTTNVLSSTVYFDHDANGFAEKTGWISAEDGFLARDLNKNGVIDNGSELFGNYTVLKDGTLAANGFEALKDLDSNNDGVFDVNDEAFHDVVVWRDVNGNGITDEGELIDLLQTGVSSIALDYNAGEESDENGNKFSQTGTFSDANGINKTIADIWFNVDLMDTKDKTAIEIPDDIKKLPNFKGIGNVHDLWTTMALDESGTLKSLLLDFINEPYEANRKNILDQIIYQWTGVADVEPDSRGSFGDARKLGALEALVGRGFFGGGCDFWADPGSDPNTKAWPEIIKLYDSVKEVLYYPLLAQSTYKGFLDDIQFSWNTQNSTWELNFEKTMSNMTTRFENDIETGHYFILDFAKNKDLYESFGNELINNWKTAARTGGSELELYLMMLNSNLYQGTPDSDILTGTGENNFLIGGNGNDTLYGDSGNDIILAGEGNDYIDAGSGDDYIDGGKGNDELRGWGGNDTYRFGYGYGQDIIWETGGTDTIEFKPEVFFKDLEIRQDSSNVIISLPDGSTLTILEGSYLKRGDRWIERLHFTNGVDEDIDFIEYLRTLPVYGTNGDDKIYGSSLNESFLTGDGNDIIYAQDGDDYLDGGAGNDHLEGGGGNDTYRFGFGCGNDTILESWGNDVIELDADVMMSDVTFSREMYDLIITLSDGSTLRIQNWCYMDSSSRYNYGYYHSTNDKFVETLKFTNGVDADIDLHDLLEAIPMQGSLNAQWIWLGAKNDIVYAGEGDNIVYGRDGNDELYGQGGNDTLYGERGDDYLDGGAGNDRLEGGAGDDIYRFGFGYGHDTILEAAGSQDVIELAPDVTASDLTFRRDGFNLIITLSDGSELTITNWSYSDAGDYRYGSRNYGSDNNRSYFVEKIKFANGVDADIDLKNLLELPMYGTQANSDIWLGELNDTYYAGGGDDNLHGREGDDKLFGEEGNDKLYGDSGNDYLDGGSGDDTLEGGSGDDTYRFGFGYGTDTISDTSGNDTIEFSEEVTAADLIYERSGNHLNISLSDGSTLIIKDCFSSTNKRIETIHFTNGVDEDINLGQYINDILYPPIYGTDGDDSWEFKGSNNTVYGGAGNDHIWNNGSSGDDIFYGEGGDDYLDGGNGNDILDGGSGNDTLIGYLGNDIYVFGRGYDQDTIERDEGGNDTISIKNATYDELWFTKDGNDLKISINGTNDSMTVKNWYNGTVIETIETDTHTLSHTDVNRLVQAMAGFNPPSGSITQDTTLSSALDETLQQTWYAKTAA